MLAARIEQGGQTVSKARSELERLVGNSPHHADWIVALGVGVACAAFARLLDVDWRAVLPIFAAAGLAQLVRKQLARWKVNVFLATAAVSFLSSILAGFGARLAASQTVARDMVVTVLLLVPGIPAFNAQFDILNGRPTLGSARAVWVAMVLIFMTLGLWIAKGVVREGR